MSRSSTLLGVERGLASEGVREEPYNAAPSLRVSDILRLMFWIEGEGRRLVIREKCG